MRATCIDMVHELARRDPRVIYIGSDLGAGTLSAMKEEMPERFFMEGVAEANMIGMAAGLAMDGYIPFVHTISTFITRRALEQVAIDLCLHKLPVRIIGNGGGLVYAPLGPTHMAVEDIAVMRSLPDMTVIAPMDAEEMRRLMPHTLEWPGPVYIRLAKGKDEVVPHNEGASKIGEAVLVRPAGDVLFVTTGVMTQRALAAAEALSSSGISCGVLHMHTLKPMDGQRLMALADGKRLVVTVEEHTLIGGLGSSVAEYFVDHAGEMTIPRLLRLGLPDKFLSGYGSQNYLLEQCGLDPEGIESRVRAVLGEEKTSSSAARPKI
ncbi:MAG: transketolase [Rhodospirillaceae bacterium]|jgi:transketolase|nr:transketolase [Rhodospirillaceae bacterium]MBT5373835.1 transketolase [Rhodospirillaceae bacterium]MBT5658950.1 transketolase [Rhodospirillaceae bacterium]MBT5752092.1 transketolase [Rhodospirillaceae bacterium]